MKTILSNYKKNPGLSLALLGLLIWTLPFILVAIDNIIGTTKPADTVISHGGVFLILVGPLLVLIGVVMIASKYVLTLLSRK